MRKTLWTSAMIGCTLLAAWILIAMNQPGKPIEARIVQVQRGDVHQVVALAGRMAYADEKIIYAQSAGRVDQVYVSPGDRVGQNEALVRMEDTAAEALVSAAWKQLYDLDITALTEAYPLEKQVIRTDFACTVRDVYIDEASMLTMGMPVARVSSHQQEIICIAAEADAAKVNPGMWAWLSRAGVAYGKARIMDVGDKKINASTGIPYVEIRLTPEQHLPLCEGEMIDADVYLGGSDDVMTLPVEAITPRDTVWWVSDGRCTEIPAEIVMTDEMLAWVALPEGISVAVGEFKNGQAVSEALE